MLSDHEREIARLEERYGHHLRVRPTGDVNGRESRAWKFLNSAFGLWLFSAVIVSSGTAVLARWYNERELEHQRKVRIEELDLEIGYRLSTAIVRLAEVQMQYEVNVRNRQKPLRDTLAEQRERTAAIIRQLNYAGAGNLPTLYPEYSEYGLPALITELRRNERVTTEQAALLQVLREVISDASLENADLPPKNWIAKITKSYLLPRWTKDFDVTDPLADS